MFKTYLHYCSLITKTVAVILYVWVPEVTAPDMGLHFDEIEDLGLRSNGPGHPNTNDNCHF